MRRYSYNCSVAGRMRAKDSLPSLARSRRFQQALGRRLHVLDRDLPAALQHDAEALHRSRVASRRLREVLPVIESPALDALARGSKSRSRVRRLTRALGGVRELDVALALLDELAAGRPELGVAAEAARHEIQRERAAKYADMMRRLDEIKPGKLTRDLNSLASDGRQAPSRKEQQRRLRERVVRRARRLNLALEEAGALYAFDRLHLVRIAAKKLRYSLELVQELARVGTTRLVARLKEAQDLLGRLHDLEILAGYVRRVRGVLPGPPSDSALALLQSIEQETRELHAQYLRAVPILRKVVETCSDSLRQRLEQA